MSNSSILPLAVLLNDYGIADYYHYVHPIFSFFTSFQSLLCTIVLANKEVRNSRPYFKYSLVNSAGAVLTFFLLGFLFVSKCGASVCSVSTTYWIEAYTIYTIQYVAYAYYIVTALIQIASGLQVYLSIKPKLKWLSSVSPYKVCLAFFGVCSLLGLLNLFMYVIDPYQVVNSNGSRTVEIYYYSHLSSNQTELTMIGSVIKIISNYVFLVILTVINIVIYVELRQTVTKRRIIIDHSTSKTDPELMKISTAGSSVNAIGAAIHTGSDYQKARERSSVRRSLIMAFKISIIFSFDRFINCLYYTTVLTNPYAKSTIYFNAITYICDMIVYSSFFFVYMSSSKLFKKKFYRIFLRRFSRQQTSALSTMS